VTKKIDLDKPSCLYVLNRLIAEGKTTEQEVLQLVERKTSRGSPQPPAKKERRNAR